MCDVDEGDPEPLLDRLQLELKRLAELRVECAERLVEQQYRGLEHKRARERNPLLLAAGQLAGLPFLVTAELHGFEHTRNPLPSLRLLHVRAPQPERDVVEDVEVGEERVALEDGVDLAAVRRGSGRVGAADKDLTLVRLLEAGDQPQRRGLAAARRAEQ